MTAALTLVTGCSSDDSPRAGDGRPVREEASASAPKAYDPPLKFGEGGVRLAVKDDDRTEVALRGTTAYVLTETGLAAYDIRGGGRKWTFAEPHGMSTGVEERARVWETTAPTVTQQGGRTLVLFALQKYRQGEGTAKDVTTSHLRAVDAADGKEVWTATLPTPKGMGVGDDSSPTVVGVEGDTAVVTLRTAPEDGTDGVRSAVTYGVNLATRHVDWQADGFGARMLSGGLVVGAQLPEGAEIDSERWFADEGGIGLVGRSVKDGAVSWKDPRDLYGLKIETVGAGLFSARINLEFKENRPAHELLDSAAGKRPAGMTADSAAAFSFAGRSCAYDERSVIVCGVDGELAALDARTHKVLWTLTEDDPSREVPSLYTAWHGVVYGGVPGRGGVLLDATTGKDRATFDAGRPAVVNEYGGLDMDLTVYPATG
ncbi:outer membrane protein assembly factor BamB family protein [Streptomyces sp. Wh19]|uniref:outer membrane protein assembly factor BamB family protein n=1 Tax=Streptomyces sp. Wh19 TaxID=3076629 RepID=UPI0029589CA6|nr:PQQ-binding-like beta-propeller repeat protein [Streptomyces sp. Wh19]MDV9200367.1 PQQ-binding-like beta-propeller repeat protein [Streptomyces sp. Wh19]